MLKKIKSFFNVIPKSASKIINSIINFLSKWSPETAMAIRDFLSNPRPKLVKAINESLSDSMTQYIAIIVGAIGVSVIFQPLYDNIIRIHYPNLPNVFLDVSNKDTLDYDFIMQFLQWFGVLYGFLLPLTLVRVWELFDDIDNIFDREADAINILAEDMLLLRDNSDKIREIRTKILNVLLDYTKHVRDHHKEESALNKNKRADELSKKDMGAEYLKEIRNQYKILIHQSEDGTQEIAPLLSELLDKLNTIIDLRGDRISLSTQRLFESLKIIAVVTTILWVVPLYFLLYTGIGFLNILLVVVVIFLVIVILSIIDDLDRPFDGLWKVDIESWHKLVTVIEGLLSDTAAKAASENNGLFPVPTDQNLGISKLPTAPDSPIVPQANAEHPISDNNRQEKPQPEPPVKKEKKTPGGISLITENPIAGVNLHKAKEAKSNGRKPTRKKNTP